MSLENRLKRGLEAHAADMEDNVTTALKDVRARGGNRRRMQFAGAVMAAAAISLAGVLAGPSILANFRDEGPAPQIPIGSDESPEPSPTPDTSPSEAPSPSVPPDSSTPESYEARTVWFTSGEFLQSSIRYVGAGSYVGGSLDGDEVTVDAQAQELIAKLLDRPNREEASVGMSSAIPAGTQVHDVTILGDDSAIVDLSAAFDDGGGSLSMRMRVAQVVWTLQPFAELVFFEIDGDPLSAVGGGSGDPARARDFEDLLAPITVTWPHPGATLTDLDTIRGTANTFEANVVYRVLDANGESVLVNDKKQPVDEWFTTATCGTGCRGTWEATLDLDFAGIQEGVLEVYEPSAENGEPMHVVRIPVTLDPAADGN